MTEKLKIWCYDDAHNWGSLLAQAAASRGHDAHLFDEPHKPDTGFVFMHMHFHPQVRTLHKRMMAVLAMNPALTLIPDYRSSVLYDDKAEQARQLARYMPRTRIFYTPNKARAFLQAAKLPFVSKSSEGSSSANVRFVQTFDEAQNEIRMAFSDIGIKCKYGQTQRGYLLWQDFIPDNGGDIRVLAIGSKRLMARRKNRDERPVANGNNIEPINELSTLDLKIAFETAGEFFTRENMRWAGIDMVEDKTTGQWRVLETTVGWTMHSYYDCEFIDPDGNATGRKATEIWNVLLDELEMGAMQ